MSVWLDGIWLSTSVATPDEFAFWKKNRLKESTLFTSENRKMMWLSHLDFKNDLTAVVAIVGFSQPKMEQGLSIGSWWIQLTSLWNPSGQCNINFASALWESIRRKGGKKYSYVFFLRQSKCWPPLAENTFPCTTTKGWHRWEEAESDDIKSFTTDWSCFNSVVVSDVFCRQYTKFREYEMRGRKKIIIYQSYAYTRLT